MMISVYKRALRCAAVLAFLLVTIPSLSFGQSFKLFYTGAARVHEKQSSTSGVSPKAYFRVDKQALNSLRSHSTIEVREMPLFVVGTDKVQLVDLELSEFSIFPANAEIIVTTANGVVKGPMPTVKTYRGKIKGVENSTAYLAVGENEISGRVSTGEAEFSVGHEAAGDELNAVIVDVMSIPEHMRKGNCDVTEDGSMAPYGITPAPPASAPKSGKSAMPQAVSVAAQLALECDFEMYEHFGSSEQAVIDWVTARFASISTVYEAEANCALQISHLNVYKVSDPYPTVGGTSPLLDAFRNHWRQSKGNVVRTTAHLMSRQAFDNPNYSSGLAGLGVLCSKDWGYGVTRVWASSTFPTLDEGVMAHEIGHNFGANHTHNCQQWGTAIDSCVTAEGDCYSGSKQVKGTIMSYCNDKAFTFGKRVSDFLKSVVEGTECLVPISSGPGKITTSASNVTISGVELNSAKDTVLTGFFLNSDTKPLSVKSVLLTGSTDFEIVSPAFPLSIAAKKSADLRIRYTPSSEVTQNALATFQLEGSEAVAQLALIGMTKQSGGGGKPLTFAAGQNKIMWGEKKVGQASDTIITIFNNTPATISTLQPKWDPTNASAQGFTIVGQQLITIGAGAVGQIKLRFNPPANKQYAAKLIIPYGVGQDTLHLSGTGSFNPGGGSGVTPARELNIEMHATPNPFTASVGIDLTMPQDLLGKSMSVEIFNTLGVSVGKLYDAKLTGDKLRLDWMPGDLDAGTYYVVARVDDAVLTRKIIYKH